VDPRRAFAAPDRFPEVELVMEWPDSALTRLAIDARTAIVTLTHDPKLDDPAMRVALQSDAFYIGALGSRRTQRARRQRLAEHGCTDAQQARIHGPVGLDIGAETPAEIAVAILAQMTAALRRGDH
jgi:xanthine dehydrogenase accessory factor